MWVAKIVDNFSTCTHALATEVIQLPHSRQQACFINVEVWLVTLTDENTLASSRKHAVSLSFVVVKEWYWTTICAYYRGVGRTFEVVRLL